MATTAKPPSPIPPQDDRCRIFLAGSIEMGKAENWQQRLERELAEYDVLILNPRRDDWDSSWEQRIDNPQFNEQVTWELDALDSADIIVMYLQPGTMSPISLLELGLHAGSGKLIICCPEGFWRKGNVDIVAERYEETLVTTLDDLVQFTKNTIEVFDPTSMWRASWS